MGSPKDTQTEDLVERSIAIGLPVFTRTEALRRCLESVDGRAIDRAIIADNGETQDRNSLYKRDWEFELTVLDLEYDIGIGACRSAIADELSEEFLVVADNDMIIPPASEIEHLLKAIEYDSSLGAVSGVVVETDQIRSGCSNLHEKTLLNGASCLLHSIQSEPSIEWVAPTLPIARFDKITNAAMIRRACIEDYSWDNRFVDQEHLDFYLGHYKYTDWEFAVCPAVVFDHQKGRYPTYREKVRSDSQYHNQRLKIVEELYRKKWGYERIEYGPRADWIDTKDKRMLMRLYYIMCEYISIKYMLPLKDILGKIL